MIKHIVCLSFFYFNYLYWNKKLFQRIYYEKFSKEIIVVKVRINEKSKNVSLSLRTSFLFHMILGHVSEQFQGYYFDIDLTSKRLQENYFQHS